MRVTIQYFGGCPHWRVAADRLAVLAEGRTDVSLAFEVIESPEHAERVGFHGSPTILLDGADAFDDGTAEVGFACRVYETPDGPEGSPSVEQLATMLIPAN
jgi:hypothetical protein